MARAISKLEACMHRNRERMPAPADVARAGIRKAEAGCLRGRGFAVVQHPGRSSASPEAHVSVIWPGSDPAKFSTDAEFDAFVEARFTGRQAVIAEAKEFLITAKSDGVTVPAGSAGLLAAALHWYRDRTRALEQTLREASEPGTPPEDMLSATQGALARLTA